MEIWKDIKGYEGLYQVSNLGNVKSLQRYKIKKDGHKETINERILKASNDRGYNRIVLCKNSYTKKYGVHRLVAQAFLGLDVEFNKNNLVCHKNDIRDDNRVENLFIGTYSDNMRDCVKKGRGVDNSGEKHGKCKFKDEIIVEIKNLLNKGFTQKLVSEIYNIDRSHISRIKNNLARKYL